MSSATVAIVTLTIGTIVFLIGIWGQIRLRSGKPLAPAGDRKSFNLVVTVGSIVIGLWLLIISAVHLLHLHHPAIHS
jgi:uncharacterized membrane protein YiaA